MPATVRDNPARHCYELEVEGHVAFAEYGLAAEVTTFIHTEVPKELGGKGVGSTLARGALEDVRRRGLRVVAQCPFIKGFIDKHAEFSDLLA